MKSLPSLPWFLSIVVIFALIVLGGLWFNGWVMSTMWAWFIVPLGVAPITLWHGVGLAMIASYFTWQYSPSMLERKRKTLPIIPLDPCIEQGEKILDGLYAVGVSISIIFIRPLVALGLGYIVKHYFMGG